MISLKENRLLTGYDNFLRFYCSEKAIKLITTCYTGILFHKHRTFGVETIPVVSHCFLTSPSGSLKDKFRPQQSLNTPSPVPEPHGFTQLQSITEITNCPYSSSSPPLGMA